MEKEDEKATVDTEMVIWVSHAARGLSFHPVSSSAYQKIAFQSEQEMWKRVCHYVDSGYRVE